MLARIWHTHFAPVPAEEERRSSGFMPMPSTVGYVSPFSLTKPSTIAALAANARRAPHVRGSCLLCMTIRLLCATQFAESTDPSLISPCNYCGNCGTTVLLCVLVCHVPCAVCRVPVFWCDCVHKRPPQPCSTDALPIPQLQSCICAPTLYRHGGGRVSEAVTLPQCCAVQGTPFLWCL